jgi:hypothetical protein
VIGIAFGLTCSALLFPAVRVRSAERALERLRTLLAHRLDTLADTVVRRERPRSVLGTGWERELDAAVEEARTAVDEAHESVRWNMRPTARRHHGHLDRQVLRTLTDVEKQVCATGRLLDERPGASRPPAEETDRTRAGAANQPPAQAADQSPAHAADRSPAQTPAPGTAQPSTDPVADTPVTEGVAKPYAQLLRTTALCVYGWRGGRPHPALPAARHALARLSDPHGAPAPARDGEKHLLHHLDATLSTLTTSASTPPRPSARTRRGVRSLRPARRISRRISRQLSRRLAQRR